MKSPPKAGFQFRTTARSRSRLFRMKASARLVCSLSWNSPALTRTTVFARRSRDQASPRRGDRVCTRLAPEIARLSSVS
ncbi:MAG: hypothetical protein DMF77_00010 [Acidobacteria bacterium]|nr:MAG: hypothetical protein DMF77_00010 [Acidobacteriota bacterium]